MIIKNKKKSQVETESRGEFFLLSQMWQVPANNDSCPGRCRLFIVIPRLSREGNLDPLTHY